MNTLTVNFRPAKNHFFSLLPTSIEMLSLLPGARPRTWVSWFARDCRCLQASALPPSPMPSQPNRLALGPSWHRLLRVPLVRNCPSRRWLRAPLLVSYQPLSRQPLPRRLSQRTRHWETENPLRSLSVLPRRPRISPVQASPVSRRPLSTSSAPRPYSMRCEHAGPRSGLTARSDTATIWASISAPCASRSSFNVWLRQQLPE